MRDPRFEVEIAIRRIRKALGLSQHQFAKKLGVSFGAVQNWETGKSAPNDRMLRRFRKLPNVDLEALQALVKEAREGS